MNTMKHHGFKYINPDHLPLNCQVAKYRTRGKNTRNSLVWSLNIIIIGLIKQQVELMSRLDCNLNNSIPGTYWSGAGSLINYGLCSHSECIYEYHSGVQKHIACHLYKIYYMSCLQKYYISFTYIQCQSCHTF